MADPRLLVVLNPASGKGAALRAEAPLGAALAGAEHRVVLTRARGHAAQLAEATAGER